MADNKFPISVDGIIYWMDPEQYQQLQKWRKEREDNFWKIWSKAFNR